MSATLTATANSGWQAAQRRRRAIHTVWQGGLPACFQSGAPRPAPVPRSARPTVIAPRAAGVQRKGAWEWAEIAVVRRDWRDGAAALAQRLGRRRAAVQAMMRQLRVYNVTGAHRWHPAEERRLRCLVQQGVPLAHIAAELMRRQSAVRVRCANLGLRIAHKRGTYGGAWSQAEIAVLRQHYQRGGCKACGPLLVQRSNAAIYSKAYALGLALGAAAQGAA